MAPPKIRTTAKRSLFSAPPPSASRPSYRPSVEPGSAGVRGWTGLITRLQRLLPLPAASWKSIRNGGQNKTAPAIPAAARVELGFVLPARAADSYPVRTGSRISTGLWCRCTVSPAKPSSVNDGRYQPIVDGAHDAHHAIKTHSTLASVAPLKIRTTAKRSLISAPPPSASRPSYRPSVEPGSAGVRGWTVLITRTPAPSSRYRRRPGSPSGQAGQNKTAPAIPAAARAVLGFVLPARAADSYPVRTWFQDKHWTVVQMHSLTSQAQFCQLTGTRGIASFSLSQTEVEHHQTGNY